MLIVTIIIIIIIIIIIVTIIVIIIGVRAIIIILLLNVIIVLIIVIIYVTTIIVIRYRQCNINPIHHHHHHHQYHYIIDKLLCTVFSIRLELTFISFPVKLFVVRSCMSSSWAKFVKLYPLQNKISRFHLAPVVQILNSAIHRINLYPVDKYLGNQLRYPLDRD